MDTYMISADYGTSRKTIRYKTTKTLDELKAFITTEAFEGHTFYLFDNECKNSKDTIALNLSNANHIFIRLEKHTPNTNDEEPKQHKFKLGDRVIVKYNDFTGTIVRLPIGDFYSSDGYIIELNDKCEGWTATVETDGVDCRSAWYASEQNIELIDEITLIPNKWYHTTDFTVEELQDLLPVGTTVLVEKEVLYDNIDTTPPTTTIKSTVESIKKPTFTDYTLVKIHNNN